MTNEASKNTKTDVELKLILSSFRLEGERVIRLSNGKEVTGTPNGKGYLQVRVGSKKDGSRRLLLLHRVKYALAFRELSEFIDHIDGDPSNNAIANLRPCTRSENAANASNPNRPLSKTGHRGVIELPNGKFMWRVMIGRKSYQKQSFDTAEEAKEAREVFKKARTGDHYRRSKMILIKPPRVNSAMKNTTPR